MSVDQCGPAREEAVTMYRSCFNVPLKFEIKGEKKTSFFDPRLRLVQKPSTVPSQFDVRPAFPRQFHDDEGFCFQCPSRGMRHRLLQREERNGRTIETVRRETHQSQRLEQFIQEAKGAIQHPC